MRKYLSQTLLILVSVFFITSCESNGLCGNCIDDLRQESITIRDQNQNPVALDDFQVINTQTNENITVSLTTEELQWAQQNGVYPLVNDFSFESQNTLEIQFQGILNGMQIISQNFTITADCCNKVTSVQGNQEVTIN